MMVYSYNDQFSGHYPLFYLLFEIIFQRLDSYLQLHWKNLPTLLDPITYCDMMPENRNSSLLGNGGKQVPTEIYMQATIEHIYKQQTGKHTPPVEGSCEHSDEPSGSLKCWEFP
jgi:hypothetical protein